CGMAESESPVATDGWPGASNAVRACSTGQANRPQPSSAAAGLQQASAPIKQRKAVRMSVDRDHHAARLDHRIGRFAGREAELVGRFVGDRGGEDLPADVDADMRGCRALLHLDDASFELIARAELHDLHSRCGAKARNALALRLTEAEPSGSGAWQDPDSSLDHAFGSPAFGKNSSCPFTL